MKSSIKTGHDHLENFNEQSPNSGTNKQCLPNYIVNKFEYGMLSLDREIFIGISCALHLAKIQVPEAALRRNNDAFVLPVLQKPTMCTDQVKFQGQLYLGS